MTECNPIAIWPQTKWQWIGFSIWFICTSTIELWLGKTKRTQAGSIFEACVLSAVWIINHIPRRNK